MGSKRDWIQLFFGDFWARLEQKHLDGTGYLTYKTEDIEASAAKKKRSWKDKCRVKKKQKWADETNWVNVREKDKSKCLATLTRNTSVQSQFYMLLSKNLKFHIEHFSREYNK